MDVASAAARDAAITPHCPRQEGRGSSHHACEFSAHSCVLRHSLQSFALLVIDESVCVNGKPDL